MYYVKVQGQNLEDLKEGLERHLHELGGHKTSSNVSVKTNFPMSAPVVEVDDDGMEEVESPYTQPVQSLHNRVIDNEVDSEGVPWDSRIHASSKAKVTDGSWRTKRGVEDSLLYQVKSELLSRVKTAPTQVEVPQAHHETQTVVVAPQTPVVAPAPIPMMPKSGHTVETFKTQFALIIASLISEGKINQDYVNELNKFFGVKELWMASDEQKANLFNSFVGYGFVQKVA